MCRSGVWITDGPHETVASAVEALTRLDAASPRVPSRTPAFPHWREEARRQLEAAGLSRKPRNVYPGQSGWLVSLTRGKENLYFGHYQQLSDALKARDEAERKYPV
jgi:hypothetical protein